MKYSNFIVWLSKPKNLWVAIFIYTILAGLFVQLILLPYIVPSWHSGNGLLRGIDGQKFHRIALELSKTIEKQGWNEWEPTPRGQLVSGIAAICYVLIYPAPWSVLPVNALLNASACVGLYIILANLVENRQKGLIATLPFIFFPSNLLWNTQFHNENYAIPGVIFILYGWIFIARRIENSRPMILTEAAKSIALIAFGSLLMGFIRVYILSGISYLFIIAGIALSIYWIFFLKIKTREYFSKLFLVLSACTIMIFTTFVIKQQDQDSGLTSQTSSSANLEPSDNINPRQVSNWSQTVWLPKVIDGQLKHLAEYRSTFVKSWADGGSSIDLDVIFRNIMDMIAYIPRSVQIAFLAPFPNLWFSEGKKAMGSAMRIASTFEMFFAYFCLLGLPIFVWAKRRLPEVWIILFVCTTMLIIYAMIIPNVGALYRFRYPYYMPLICFGLAGWMLHLENSLIFGIKKTL